MIIREVESWDQDALLEFYWSLSEAVREVFLPAGPVTPDSVRSHLLSVEEGRCIGLVLEQNGAIMGHAFVQCLDTDKPMVSIGLRDAVIGCGYGRKMLERLLAKADEMGLPATYLTVVKTNHRAEALYQRMGYVRVGVATFRKPNDSWYMKRELPSRPAQGADAAA